jgi:hypothetical protein
VTVPRLAVVLAACAMALGMLSVLAAPATATSTPAFLSSAPPVALYDQNYTYVVQTSIPVNWTFPTEPSGCSINSDPLSQNAAVQCRFTSTGSQSFSVRGIPSGGGKGAWQNWTVSVLNYPYIEGNPYMTPNAGDYYSFSAVGDFPSGAGPVSWTFKGAPYLAVNSATGQVTGTVTAGTYSNFLTENSSKGNYTLAWVTTTNQGVGSITGTCYVGHHSVTYTIGLAGGQPAGCGNAGIFYGNTVLLSSVTPSGTDSWNFVYTGPGPGAQPIQFTYNGSSATSAKYYAYAAPGSSVAVQINGGTPSSAVATGSNGSAEITVTPQTYIPPAQPGGGGGPPPCTGAGCTVVVPTHAGCSSVYNSPCIFLAGVAVGPLTVVFVIALVGGAVIAYASKKGQAGEIAGLVVAAVALGGVLLFP